MKRLIIPMSVLFLLASFSLAPTFAGIDQISDLLSVQKELISTENEEPETPKTDYVTELNKLGMAGRPESDNAAPYYEKAIEFCVEKPESLKISTTGWPKEMTAQQQATLKKWVQDNNRALEQIQLGSKKTYCWFQHTGEKLQSTEMPHLSTERQLAFTLQARAMLSAEDGNINAAVDDIVTLYTFGAHVAEGPKPLIEKLVGIAIKSLSIKAAFNILDKKMADANLMKSLEDKFKQLVTNYSEPFDIRGEKIYTQEQIETDPTYRGFKPYLKSTLEYYDTIAAKTSWQLHNETQSITKDNPLIETAGSAMPRVIEIESRIRADEQALITTIAILRYNANSDGYPGALSQLVSAGYIKELPKDPFNDKPLVYKRTREGFTLYSFGEDYDDDGGLHSKWGSGEEGGDQVFWPVEQPQMAERPSGRERSFARTESPQRRARTDARSAPDPYQMDDEQEGVRARPRQDEQEQAKTLHDAARDGDIDQVQLLLSKGANVNEKNRMGWTPLHTAIRNRRLAIIEPLIAKGADINAADNRGQTPLLAAVYISQKDAVELLIAKGADVNLMGGGDNALSLAKKRNNKEIVDLLLKHGAKEPSPQDLMGDRYYGDMGGVNPYPGYEEQATTQRRTRTFSPVAQSPVQVDILADPNEIKARIKTFEGLDKALEEVDANSQNEMRQWQQKRYDNRTMLIRTVQKQFEDEIGVIRKAAVEEKAKKTTETIDSLLTEKQERLKEVSKELLMQKRELRQTQPASGRGRARTSGRSTRGRTSQRGQPYEDDMTDPLYGGRGDVRSRTTRPQSTRRPSEEVDIETENEINQWLQADVEDKTNLAEAVHEQIQAEISSVRSVAVEEETKKTTAAIDGVLLYRQMRFDALIQKMEEEQQTLRQQTQDPRTRDRTSGRRSLQSGRRGGTGVQGEQTQQENQPRTRRRR
ncbi:MAG TPA: ankyrin repeat domain-containing protein [Sedimentisphaerales bacterium]|nr:ankyrin repeat domain-containing protein [Sedimentisphaerales bacterium]